MKVNIDSVLRNLDLPSDVVEYFPKISIAFPVIKKITFFYLHIRKLMLEYK